MKNQRIEIESSCDIVASLQISETHREDMNGTRRVKNQLCLLLEDELSEHPASIPLLLNQRQIAKLINQLHQMGCKLAESNINLSD